MAATSAVRWWLTARFPHSGLWLGTRTHANGPADAGRTRLLFAAEIFPMNVFSRYLIRHLFLGFAAAAGYYCRFFTTFNLINELDDVSPGGYRWTGGAGGADDLTAHTGRTFAVYCVIGDCWSRAAIENSELTAIRSTGFLSSVLHWWRWLPGYCGLFR